VAAIITAWVLGSYSVRLKAWLRTKRQLVESTNGTCKEEWSFGDDKQRRKV